MVSAVALLVSSTAVLLLFSCCSLAVLTTSPLPGKCERSRASATENAAMGMGDQKAFKSADHNGQRLSRSVRGLLDRCTPNSSAAQRPPRLARTTTI